MKKNQPLTKYIFQPGAVVRQLRILVSQFSPTGHERVPKSVRQHALAVNAKLENQAIHKIIIFTSMKEDIQKNQNNLIDNIKEIIFSARKSVAINVNNELITAYWNI
ncbi:hypothetical protein [Draconibacterium orientale]|uniref:hypothetical protein n=1 Tax=Draconibacterium orientale TaxID=1168034 RepID=UPI002ABE230D|nr:hypothetical protein [Draconibacterium orientale]